MLKSCMTYIHHTVCKYVKKSVKLYVKQTIDTVFGFISIDILDIYITIWIYILQFGYMYYNLDIYCNLDIKHSTGRLHMLWDICVNVIHLCTVVSRILVIITHA